MLSIIDRPKSVILFAEASNRVITIIDPCQVSNPMIISFHKFTKKESAISIFGNLGMI